MDQCLLCNMCMVALACIKRGSIDTMGQLWTLDFPSQPQWQMGWQLDADETAAYVAGATAANIALLVPQANEVLLQRAGPGPEPNSHVVITMPIAKRFLRRNVSEEWSIFWAGRAVLRAWRLKKAIHKDATRAFIVGRKLLEDRQGARGVDKALYDAVKELHLNGCYVHGVNEIG